MSDGTPPLADRLSARLAQHSVVVVDGGVVDGLHALGLPLGEPPEGWCLDRPDAVLDVHRGLAAAGAEIVTTNSAGANQGRYGGEAEAICAASVRLARIAAPGAAIAGALGPVGSPFERRFLFTGQAAALASAGADLLWFEALADDGDASAAFEAARPTGIPYVLTFDPGSVLGDLDAVHRFVELVASASRRDPRPIATGVDSGFGPELALKAIGAIGALDLPLVVRANAGLPELKGGTLVRPFGVEEMSGYAIVARRLGARIVGGFGGVDSTLLAAIADAL